MKPAARSRAPTAPSTPANPSVARLGGDEVRLDALSCRIMRRAFALTLCFAAAACVDEPPPARPVVAVAAAAPVVPVATDAALPVAHNVAPLVAGVATIVVDADRVLLDGAVVGDVSALASPGRPQRIAGLFDALGARRDAWKAQHPDAAYPGTAELRLRRDARARVVKSVFSTATTSGHPNLAFVVETDPEDGPPRVARILVDAEVPAPPGQRPKPAEPVLYVRISRARQVVMQWRRGFDVLSETEVPWSDALDRRGEVARAPGVASRVSLQWPERGAHRGTDDTELDRAVLVLDDDVELRELVATLDALYEPKRNIGGGARVPVFNVKLSMLEDFPKREPPPPTLAGAPPAVAGVAAGPTTVSGRLPPEVVERIVRADFPGMRRCYDAGLAKNPRLAGTVTVRFVIRETGNVTQATDGGSDLPDAGVVKCVVARFASLGYPAPSGGVVAVTYPIRFAPGSDAPLP